MQRRSLSFLALAGFTVLSLTLRENYPISHFPMYGNPSDDVYYHWLADARSQQPLPIVTHTGLTAPKLGKLIKSYTEDRAKELHIQRKSLPQAELHSVCVKVLQQLRHSAQDIRQQLPPQLAIMRTDIHYQNGQLTEVTTPLYAE
jgi:hypothetical protein